MSACINDDISVRLARAHLLHAQQVCPRSLYTRVHLYIPLHTVKEEGEELPRIQR
jgi:hypothetical protein